MFNLKLDWQTYQNGDWCEFQNVNLAHSHFDSMEGVYIIWHGGSNAHTVYVGQGDIKECILRHRQEVNITKYNNLNPFVTWAKVDSYKRDGIERYLANRLNPLEGKNWPDVTPISVNLPW